MSHLDDYFEENEIDLDGPSPPPELLEGTPKWRAFLAQANVKKIILAIFAVVLVIVAICLGIFIVVFIQAGGDNEGSSEEPTITPTPTPTPSNFQCEPSYSEPKGTKYTVMIDLGSSGSRVSIFEWTDPQLVQPAPKNSDHFWYDELRPGISSYAANATKAGPSLIPLLDYAVNNLNCIHVNISTVSIFGYATAGMRVLPREEQLAVLQSVRDTFRTYEFMFQDEWVRIISGSEEATFDWLSVQQIYKLYDRVEETIGVVDLGGGSVEIAFQTEEVVEIFDPENIILLNFNETLFDVYGYSFLHYGHNEAFVLVEELLVRENHNAMDIPNPCLLVGYNETKVISGSSHQFYGTSNGAECAGKVMSIFDKTNCPFSSCSFNQAYQPPISSSRTFLGLDNVASVGSFFNMTSQLQEIQQNTMTYCDLTWTQAQTEYVDTILDGTKLQNMCFEGLFVFHLLTTGFGFAPSSEQIILTGDIYGMTVSWALGAAIHNVQYFLSV